MARFDPIVTNFNSGEISKLAFGRVDIEKYANSVDTLENFLNMIQGGIVRRPGQRYVASTKDNGKAKIIPFQYSADLDYLMEMGGQYFRLYSNGAALISQTANLTKLLLGCDHTVDASFEFLDTGNTGHIVTNVATAQTSPLQKKFGSSSLLLDGNSDYLTVPDHADWDFTGSALDSWTIEFQVKFADHADTEILINQDEGAGNNVWKLSHVHGSGFVFNMLSGGVTKITLAGAGEISDIDWHHVALIKVADKYAIYVDGVQVSYTESSDTDTFASLLYIGQSGAGGGNLFQGNLDEIRIIKSNIFTAAPNVGLTNTITVPTAAHTSDGDTHLLLNCESQDASNNAHRIQFQGTAQLDTAVKKFGTASLLLNGNSDYLQIPDHVDFDMVKSPDDNWTIDLWAKFTDHVGTETLVVQWEDANNYWLLQHVHGSGLRFIVVSGGVTIITTGYGGEITGTDQTHIAICKVGTKYGLYKAGTQVAYVDDNSTDTFAGGVYIGATGAPGDYFDGSIDDVRIINSNAFSASPNVGLTDTIVVPTSAHTVTGEQQTEISTPYLEADLFQIMDAHKGDIKYLTHASYAPRTLSRTDATTFTLALVPFVRGPFLDDDTSGTTITPSADTGTDVTLTASAAIFTANHVGALWRVKSGVVKIVTFTSTTVVTGDVQAEPDGSAGNLATGPGASSDWAEGAFSDERGWPAVCTFHSGRLYYASTTHEPQKEWGSVVFEYNNFDKDDASADDAVTFELGTEVRIAVRWMASGNKKLSLGASGGTYSAFGSGNGPIIPGDIETNRDTDYGSALLKSKRIGAFTYYIQRDLRKVRELRYFFDYDVTDAGDMNMLAEHILREGNGVVDWDYQQTPNDRLWCVRKDGQLAVMTRNSEQQALGWSRVIAGADSTQNGKYESVCVIPKTGEDDQVWVVVNRTIGGVTKRFLEYFTLEKFDQVWDAICLDSSLTLDSPITISGATKANPVVITATGHGLSNGDQVKIDEVVGMTELNGNSYLVASKTDDTFELQTLASVDVDGTAYTTYISGGEARLMVTAISGLDHLEGETVQVQVDGGVPATNSFVVTGGAITLAAKAAVVHVGLPFEVHMKTLRSEGGSRLGTSAGKIKRIHKVTARFYKTLFCKAGTSTTQDNFSFSSLYTGDKSIPLPMGWETPGQLTIKSDKPLPLTLIALVPQISVSDL